MPSPPVRPAVSFNWGYVERQARRGPPRNTVRSWQPRRYRYTCDVTTGLRATTPPDLQIRTPSVDGDNDVRCRSVYVAPHVRVRRVGGKFTGRMVVAAGILFSAVAPDGSVHFLLGRERYYSGWRDSNRWADAGGRVESVDNNVADAASREAFEEVMGTVDSRVNLRARLNNNESAAIFDVQHNRSGACYRMYILQVEMKDYGSLLLCFKEYLREMRVNIAQAEKTRLEWVSAAEMLAMAEASANGNSSGARLELRPNFARSICAIGNIIDLETVAK